MGNEPPKPIPLFRVETPTPEATWRVIARETVAKLRKAADEIERCLDAKG